MASLDLLQLSSLLVAGVDIAEVNIAVRASSATISSFKVRLFLYLRDNLLCP